MDTSQDPTIVDGATYTHQELNTIINYQTGIHANQACTQATFMQGPEDDLGRNDCWYSSKIGDISSYGYMVKEPSSEYVGFINNSETRLVPTVNPDMFIEFVPADSGGYELHFRNLESAELQQKETGYEYPVWYEFVKPATKILKNSDGEPWVIEANTEYQQMWYSKNKKWMILWDKNGVIVRINLQTLDVLTLQGKLVIDENDWFARLGISEDGASIVVNILGRPLRIIDAGSCQSYETDYVSEPRVCSISFLDSYIKKATNTPEGFGFAAFFKEDNVLEFYAPGQNGDEVWSYYVFAPGVWESRTYYIALGDSYASGEGAHNYFRETNIKNINKCHLSRSSYPYLVEKRINLQSTHSVACSGARIKNITGPEYIDNELKDPERTNQYEDGASLGALGQWTPGYYLQKQFIVKNKPNIATLSIGGNDIGFAEKVRRCVMWPDTCYKTYEDRVELVEEIHNTYDELVDTYQTLKSDAATGARLYIIGYPQIARAGGTCDINVRLNNEEIIFSNQVITYLNNVIQRAANRVGVVYVDIENALNGHRLCENGEKAVNGLTFGDDKFNILGNESYHPNALGHRLIADAILRQTQDFTQKTPRENVNISEPYMSDASLLLDGTDRTGRRTLATKYNDDIDRDFIIRGSQMSGVIRGAHYGLQPNHQYTFVLTSTPVELGQFTANSQGDLTYDFAIPQSVDPGFHTLHIYGENQDGREIDLHSHMYIAFSDEDWDGDGILNKDNPCKIGLPRDNSNELDYSWCQIFSDELSTSDAQRIQDNMPKNLYTKKQEIQQPAQPRTIQSKNDDVQQKGQQSKTKKRDPTPQKQKKFAVLPRLAIVAVIFLIVVLLYRKRQKRNA